MKLLLFLQLCFLGSAVSNELVSGEEKKLWNGIGTFGHSLSQKLASLSPQGNMLVSPFSVATALGMTIIGARNATKQEMYSAMNLQGFADDAVKRSFLSTLSRKHENTTQPTDPFPSNFFTLLAANRMYFSNQIPIQDNFKNDVQKNFHADALAVDFVKDGTQIQNDINHFVEERTKGLIKDILTRPLSQNSILALINTLYFKGHWVKRMTQHQNPTLFNEGCGALQLEHSKRLTTTSRFRYIDSAVLQAQMILLPYMSENFSAEMLILLPKKEHNCEMQRWFNQVSWNNIQAEMKKMTYENVALEMPAFELNGRFNLEEVLPTLGMSLAFTPGRANFTGISNQPLHIDKVIHQTKMIVTRYGTEAAAATVIAVNRLAAIQPTKPPVPMIVNRSFYLSIIYHAKQDDSAILPLFSGVVNKV